LENSGHIVALVVHTGIESKLIMNLGQYRFKRSRFEMVLNYVLVFNLSLAILLSIGGAFQNNWWTSSHIHDHQYIFAKLDDKNGATLTAIKAFFSFYLIVNSFVPLDLLCVLEVSKLVYTPFMEADGEMMVPDYVVNDVKGMECHSLSLHEELGLVEYLFCDKTGTLTQNELVFRKLAMPDGKFLDYTNEPFSKIGKDLESSDTGSEFWNCIALCNDCISVKDGDKLTYNGPSVDEVCLLEMALDAKMGYFVDRDSSHVRV
jgi:phospholipid-transporting ATPase